MLKITGDGRKAALDMRLVDPFAQPGDTKVSRAIEKIHSAWAAGKERRLTQLVFCDLSTPNPDRFNVYDEVRDKLIAKGIPAKEIAYIHDAETDSQKKTLFDAVNAGRVRILLGSTEKMGAGTNVQKRLIALHHLDAPWRPRDIEQREGRILRQGNDNPEIQIHRYVTEGSFDAYMWQVLETKARFINQVMNGSVTVRQAEDLEGGALTYAEIKAIASGNPAVMEKVKVDTEIRKLDQLRASHINQQHNIRWQVKSLPEQIERARKYHAAVSADILTRDARADEEFTMKVGNRVYTGKGAREDAGNALATRSSCRGATTRRCRCGAPSKVSRSSAGAVTIKDGEPDLVHPGQGDIQSQSQPRKIRWGRYRASSTPSALSIAAPRKNSMKSSGRRRPWPITVPNWAVPSSMKPDFEGSAVRSRHSLTPASIWTSTRRKSWTSLANRGKKRPRQLRAGRQGLLQASRTL